MSSLEKNLHSQWKQDKLELPKVIRQPGELDVPRTSSMLGPWNKRKTVSLHEGFTYTLNKPDNEINFKFYSEINVNNSNLYHLFISLIETIDGTAQVVFKDHYEEDITRCEQKFSVEELKSKFDTLEYYITNNCSVSIGVVHFDEALIEVFIDESKYIRYWGSDEERFRRILNGFNIKEYEKLEFVDQYPKIVYALDHIEEDCMSTEELIKTILIIFD